MNEHISIIAQTCYFDLHPLSSICIFMISTANASLASTFVLSRINYCNSLLFGSTHDVTSHFQWTQNLAARVTMHIPKSANIITHLKSLHLLPINVKSTCKIACLCYQCHISTAPSYVTDMLQKKPSHSQHFLQLTHHAFSQ